MIIGHVRDRYLMAVFFFHAKKKSPRLLGGSQFFAYLCDRYNNFQTQKSYTQMRQVLFMAVLAAGMLLTGCSKDEDNSMKFTISENLVSLLAHDDYKITPSGAFTARSSNEDVATVNADGVIHAVSAGNADIIFTSVESPDLTQTCKVNVDWRYKYFEEPVIAFGATKEEIKARETHEVRRERDKYIVYEYPGVEMTMSVSYTFDDDDSLYKIGLGVIDREKRMSWVDDFLRQLQERYGDYSEVDGFKIFISKKGGYKISSNLLDILYTSEAK